MARSPSPQPRCFGLQYMFTMRTISITIDEPLLGRLDRAAEAARRTRSDLFRLALREWLDDRRRRQLVAEDRAAYEAHPVRPDEFDGLIAAQVVDGPELPNEEGGDSRFSAAGARGHPAG